MAAIAAEHCRCVAAVVVHVAVVPWVFIQWDRPTLEQEVASCSWWEG
jgi:hypothetical protein